jgi:stage IV sporulation protein A
MTQSSIYRDIATRTGGDIYLGIVGPVRSGKSTFIKRFMDTLVIPNIADRHERERATDELPQSASGRTIMTTEPKFIPEEAVPIRLDDNATLHVRMIDCVGYIVPSSIGYIENDQPRMVKTPWYDEPIPFNMAAEIGTKKVITEHSTIGIVVTTDGSISDIPRAEYAEAEERVIQELKDIRKPFAVLLNCTDPDTTAARTTAAQLEAQYQVPVLPVNCRTLTTDQIQDLLSRILLEFPVREIRMEIPRWLAALEKTHPLRQAVFTAIRQHGAGLQRMRDVRTLALALNAADFAQEARILTTTLSNGSSRIRLEMKPELFYQILGDKTGHALSDEGELFDLLVRLSAMEQKYERIREAMDSVNRTGYGIVMPDTDELTLEEPEISRQNGKYGIRLKASAPSIHMLRADITTEVAPIVGTEKQSEELVQYLMNEFNEDPAKLWGSNIFGKSLNDLVSEGLRNKLYRMPEEARMRLKETLEKIINEGCNALICIIL